MDITCFFFLTNMVSALDPNNSVIKKDWEQEVTKAAALCIPCVSIPYNKPGYVFCSRKNSIPSHPIALSFHSQIWNVGSVTKLL